MVAKHTTHVLQLALGSCCSWPPSEEHGTAERHGLDGRNKQQKAHTQEETGLEAALRQDENRIWTTLKLDTGSGTTTRGPHIYESNILATSQLRRAFQSSAKTAMHSFTKRFRWKVITYSINLGYHNLYIDIIANHKPYLPAETTHRIWNESSVPATLRTPLRPLISLTSPERALLPGLSTSPSTIMSILALSLSSFSFIAFGSNSLPPMTWLTGGAGLNRRLLWLPSSSTRTTIHTPTAPPWPINGVQCIHRLRPSSSPSSSMRVNQRIFAVTPRPSANAWASSVRTRGEPPIRERKGLCKIPGTRSDGEVKRMRKDGAGRTSR